MIICFQSMWIELPYSIVSITGFQMSESLNAHSEVQLIALIEDETGIESIIQDVEQESITIGIIEGETMQPAFFVGYITSVELFFDKGQAMLLFQAASYTKKWDIKKRNRSFQNLDASYADIIKTVIDEYKGASWLSNLPLDKPIPGFILQYEETDWEFLCRIASHFSAFLIVDAKDACGRIHFGLPELDYGHEVTETDYDLSQDIIEYRSDVQNTGSEYMMQDNLVWRLIGTEHWQMGEQVYWGNVVCQVIGIHSVSDGTEPFYSYSLGRKNGIRTQPYGNQNIIGMSLEGIIKERSGNQLRVHFKIDPSYQAGNNVYFTYAIETVSWYCIPEIGSLVHIYFPSWDESIALAIHAMRMQNTSRQSNSGRAVSDKSFSTSAGTEMVFTEKSIMFVSDASNASTLSVNGDGTLSLNGTNISLVAASVKIGESEEGMEQLPAVTANSVSIEAETGQVGVGLINSYDAEELELREDMLIGLNDKGCIVIKANDGLYYHTSKFDSPSTVYSDEALTAQDAQAREAHNSEVMYERHLEAEAKKTSGGAFAVAGLIVTGFCLAAATILATGGSGGPGGLATVPAWKTWFLAAGATIGASATAHGSAEFIEGVQDDIKMHSGDFSKSSNPILEHMYNDNRDAYHSSMAAQVMMAQGFLFMATAPAPIPSDSWIKDLAIIAAKQGLTQGALAIESAFLMDISDGFINMSLNEYMTIGGKNAAVGAFGVFMMGPVLNWAKGFVQLNPYTIIGLETAFDVGLDWGASRFLGTDFDLYSSIFRNLVTNAVFSIDPVDVVTGGMFQTETDLVFHELGDEDFSIKRYYNSNVPYFGLAGKKWRFSFESGILFREDKSKADVYCEDGHTESFILKGGEYENKKGGNQAYSLSETDQGEYCLYSHEQKKRYYYGQNGVLLAIKDRLGHTVQICYEGQRIDKIITYSGHQIKVTYQGNYIVALRDDADRTVQYTYDQDCLINVCHVDQGIVTYEYDEHSNLTQIVNAAGYAFIRNEYDDKDRVVAQYYPDGTKSTVAYDDEKRESVVYIAAFDRTERYCYDKENLITHTYFDDGTCIEYGYDQWQNRVFEQDRMGDVSRKQFDSCGNLLSLCEMDGQTWHYQYDDSGYCIRKWSDGGPELRYYYDDQGSLLQEEIKVRDGSWSSKKYEVDRHGRVVKAWDGNGAKTEYRYDIQDQITTNPSLIIDALGQEIRYEYDDLGRKTAIMNSYGRVEFGYNNRDYVTLIRDGEGNETRKSYDAAGNLLVVVPPNQMDTGDSWSYQYDFFNRLIEQKDPLGTVTRTERDLAGHVLKEVYPRNYIDTDTACSAIEYDYDQDRYQLRKHYPDGSTERMFYDANGMVIKRVKPEDYNPELDDGPGETYEYGPGGRLLRTYDEEGALKQEMVYDLQGNVIEEHDAEGHITYHSYDLAGNLTETRTPVWEKEAMMYRVVRYEYDMNFNRTKELHSLDAVKKEQQPRRWKRICYTYDKLNRLIKVTDGGLAQINYRYDCLNQKIYEAMRINESTWRRIHYEYDRAGRLVTRKEELEQKYLSPGKKHGAAWAVTQYEYDRNGNCISIRTPKGYEKYFVYDAVDRLIKQTEVDVECGINRVYEYQYDCADNLIARMEYWGEEQLARHYQYNCRNLLTHFTDEEGGVTRIHYDRNGRISKVIRPEQYDAETDDGMGLSYCYNHQDLLHHIISADGSTLESYTYDRMGRRQSQSIGDLEYQYYSYDIGGNLTGIYNGKEKKQSQSYTYDAQGNLTGLCDGNGNKTRFTTDEWGRITEIHNPDGGVELYTYDSAGNITSTTDANGGTITYRYNGFGHLCEIIDQEGHQEFFYYDEEGRGQLHIDRNGNEERTHYNMDHELTYRRGADRNGRNAVVYQYSYYPDGNLKEAIGGGITYGYEYTKSGRLKRKTANGVAVLTYEYDRNGNVVELKQEDGTTAQYRYDELDRLKCVSKGAKELAAYQYNQAGQIAEICYGNGSKSSYQYTDAGQMAQLTTVTDDGRVVLDYQYLYDGNGNITEKSGVPYQNRYQYDNMNRIRSVVYDQKESEWYSYDQVGNRIKKGWGDEEETYFYNKKNQLTELKQKLKTLQYRYDDQGNLLEEDRGETKQLYQYDPLNRQCQVENSVTVQKNYYDGEELRYAVEADGSLLHFVYDRQELVAEKTAENERHYIRGHDIIASDQLEEMQYYYQDEIRSVLFILDEGQNIVKSYRYDAFGNILDEGGVTSNRIAYTGQVYDKKVELYYLRTRYYKPRIGRFAQEDVYRGDGLNLYVYCQNNPINYYDPSGYMSLCPRSYTSSGRMSDDLLLYKKTNSRNADNITEWRRTIEPSDIAYERTKFLGDNAVKVANGTWRSLDGTRQFRTVPRDYSGAHGIGSPTVSNTPHVHFEFLAPPNPGGNKLRVIKNVHVPLRKGGS